MKIRLLFAAAVLVITAGCSKTPEAKLYCDTVSKVDTEGLYLNYMNTESLMKTVSEFPASLDALAAQTQDREVQYTIAGLKLLIRSIKPTTLHAFAGSAKTVKPNELYCQKFFLNTQGAFDGLFTIAGDQNVPFSRMESLPADTLFACGGVINYGRFLNLIVAEMQKDPMLKQYADQANLLAPVFCQADLKKSLDTLNGEVFILVNGNIKNLGFTIVCPDANGVLAKVIRNSLRANPNAQQVSLPIPMMNPAKFAPVIQFGKADITFVSHISRLSAKNEKLLFNDPVMKDYKKFLPNSGLSFCVVNLDKSLAKEIAADINDPSFTKAAADFPGFKLVSACKRTNNGFLATAYSNIYISPAVGPAAAAFISSVILPALNSSRQKAQTASCASNLKRIIVCVILYESEKQKLPDSLNELGNGYLKDRKIYTCPVSSNGYVYVRLQGAIANIAVPAVTPLVFDKPGAHGNRINVAFADGHVETVNLPFKYTNADQVVQYFSAKNPKVAQTLKTSALVY